jgi:NADH:ubiquinone oxidoreductase subunit 6 (subunit J)
MKAAIDVSQDLQQKAFYGALFLFALVLLGAGLGKAGAEGAAFGLFAFLTLGGGLVCIWERSVVRSAFALMATFSGVAGFFVLLGADYLAMAQLLVYVGGILALILFAVMLTPPDLTERKLSRVLGGLVAMGAVTAWLGTKFAGAVRFDEFPELPPAVEDNATRIGVGFLAREQYVLAFELAAVVLTVALVAAVYVARRKRSDMELPPGIGGMGSGGGGAMSAGEEGGSA